MKLRAPAYLMLGMVRLGATSGYAIKKAADVSSGWRLGSRKSVATAEATIARRLRFQAEACRRVGSPLYAGLLDRAAADVEAQGPTWEVLSGRERDPGPSALALRLMGAINRLVLLGEEPELAAVYSEGGGDEVAAWRTFSTVLERNVETLRELVGLPVQTNEVGRCAALLPGFLTVAAQTGLPLRLLEVGASAGLNLRWDRYRYLAGGLAWGPPDSPVTIDLELQGDMRLPIPPRVAIAERRGCDAAPIDPSTQDGRLSLLAYVWPDQRARIERLRAALDVASELPVAIDREGATSWVERRLRERSPGRVTVLFHSIFTQYLSEEELATFRRCVHEAGERATDEAPLAWLRMEPAGERADVWLRTWPGGEDRHLARAGYHGTPVRLTA